MLEAYQQSIEELASKSQVKVEQDEMEPVDMGMPPMQFKHITPTIRCANKTWKKSIDKKTWQAYNNDKKTWRKL